MLPTANSRPDDYAIRCVVLGSVIAAIWWCPPGQLGALLLGSMQVGEQGETLWREMLPRCGRTLALVIVAATFAVAFGTLVAFGLASVGHWTARLVTWAGQLLAALPVAGLSWCAMAWLVNDLQLPVESLLPYSPPAERDSWSLALGRWVWCWAVPFWVLAVPMTGLWLSDLAERLRLDWPLANPEVLEARGIGGLRLRWGYWLRAAWVPLVDRWLRLCVIGLGLSIGVESVFGVQGWGGFVARNLAMTGSGIAVAVYSGAWMMAALGAISWGVQRLRRASDSGEEWSGGRTCSHFGDPSSGKIFLAWVAILGLWLLAVQPAPAEWMRAFAGALFAELLPGGWSEKIDFYQSAVLMELARASRVALQAGMLSVLVGTLAWGVRRAVSRRLPHLDGLRSLAWSPLLLLVFLIPADMPAWHYGVMVLAVADGACLWRGHFAALEAQGYVQSSRALGVSVVRSVWRHGGILLVMAMVGWMLRLAGTVVVWCVAATSVQVSGAPDGTVPASPESLGGFIAAYRSTILTDVDRVLWPVALATIVTWIFWRLSSALRLRRSSSE